MEAQKKMVGRGKGKAQERWDEVVRHAKALIPSVEDILDEALGLLQLDECFIQSEFGEALRRVDEKATGIYLGYERKALIFAAECWLEANRNHLQVNGVNCYRFCGNMVGMFSRNK